MVGSVDFTRSSPMNMEYAIDENYLAGADSQTGILESGELWGDRGMKHTLTETGRQRYEALYQAGKMNTEYEDTKEQALEAIAGKGQIDEERYA